VHISPVTTHCGLFHPSSPPLAHVHHPHLQPHPEADGGKDGGETAGASIPAGQASPPGEEETAVGKADSSIPAGQASPPGKADSSDEESSSTPPPTKKAKSAASAKAASIKLKEANAKAKAVSTKLKETSTELKDATTKLKQLRKKFKKHRENKPNDHLTKAFKAARDTRNIQRGTTHPNHPQDSQDKMSTGAELIQEPSTTQSPEWWRASASAQHLCSSCLVNLVGGWRSARWGGALWRSLEDKSSGKLKSKDIDEVLNEYIRTHHPGEVEVVLTTFAETSAEVDTDLTATLNYHQLCRTRDSELQPRMKPIQPNRGHATGCPAHPANEAPNTKSPRDLT
jgi:myosin heavy subunit